LPEGAIAVYPEKVYVQMRGAEERPVERASNSLVFRRSLRRFGAMSQPQAISKQGRLTLPPAYRDYADLQSGAEAVVIGVEIGVEIWNAQRWAEELNVINGHISDKGDMEMAEDLIRSGEGSK
jgi:DNA-binding transcriptional regulator/RsmH inhibitor MraZ